MKTQNRAIGANYQNRNMGGELLRIAASFLVVLLHTATYLFPTEDVHSALFCAGTLYNALGRVAVPLFVMLSGAFLLDPAKPFSFRKFAKKNIVHIAVAFLFWSTIYAVYDVCSYADSLSLKTVVSFVFTVAKGMHHLWYLKMLLGLYLIVPLLRRITTSETLTRYFIALAFVFCFTANLLEKTPVASQYLFPLVDSMQLKFVTGYAGVFVAGYYLLSTDFSKRVQVLIYAAGALSALATVAGTFFLSFRAGEQKTVLFNYLFPTVFLWTAALFLLGKSCNDWFPGLQKHHRFWTGWSSLTFGIYLVHLLVTFAVGHWHLTQRLPFLTIPAAAVLIYLLSALATLALKQIPLLRRYVI